MGSECGKVLAEGDLKVSEAVDFAYFYAERGRDLERIPGASPKPVALTVVTPPWNFPFAIPAGGTLAALAAGSPVVLKPARQARRTGALLAEILWGAGAPRDVLTYVSLDSDERAGVTPKSLGQRLLSHPEVGRVILTGAYETAEQFRSFKRDLPLIAAGLRSRSRVTVSAAVPIPAPIRAWLTRHQVPAFVEDATAWQRRVQALADQGGRVRHIGDDRSAVFEASGGSPR